MVGMICDKGNYRKINQDYVGYFESDLIKIYVIADGMGGYNGGEIASKIAVDTTIKYIRDNYDENISKVLKRAIEFSNKEIMKKAKEESKLKGMGTTITTCCIYDENNMSVANIGDSSCYVLYDNEIRKITKDHSFVQELIDMGNISVEEAKKHPNRNIITRALGTKEEVKVDIYDMKLEGIKKIVLCTDGLSNYVSEMDMYEALNQYGNEQCCKELVELSKQNGSTDNISIIVFEGEC